ncbi:MAG: nickel-type superoxide dismutase maturation protease [Nitriliruptor sp.]|uniref:nickel-type superoxide dismutase maturation protease n=1 Tax=Nitriliruptor sp. TaxID=2448056 RepID=UPI0034A01DFD
MARGRWLAGLGLAAAVYGVTLAVNRSVVEVRGASMEPTLWRGDRLLTVPARPAWVRPGRVVVVADPDDPDHLVIKRIASSERGRVVVLGDNPGASTDSRSWGPVPIAAVRRIVLRRWPDLRTRLHR